MVRGLTTYINYREDKYMEVYELPHNSVLIVDGDSVAINIYLQLDNRNTCFGGDYDKYADEVSNFFDMLSDCKVIPYVLFDGATDQRKVQTAGTRLRSRIRDSLKLNCTDDNVAHVTPLYLTEVFKEILKKRKIAMVMCMFECDGEVANIANQLNCPVLSYDSDYFIFNVKYIPFMVRVKQNLHVISKLVTNKNTNTKETQKYLRCKMFRRYYFLSKTRLSQDKLPILSVYLGNDAIERVKDVPHFFKYLNVRGQDFVDVIIRWLAHKSIHEAIQIMLAYYANDSLKKQVKEIINETLDEYKCKESKYLQYLQIGNVNECSSDSDFQFENNFQNISRIFINKYIKCFYHHHFLDILIFHKYYPRPLVENIRKCHSHTPSLPLVSAIHKILTSGSTEAILFYGRVDMDLSTTVIPECEMDLPNYDDLQNMDSDSRKEMLINILGIEEAFVQNSLEVFPNSWHIFLLAIKYMSNISILKCSLIYSLVLSKIMLTCVDKKVGRIRSWKELIIYECGKRNTNSESVLTDFSNVTDAFDRINSNDCYNILRRVIEYFAISPDMKNNRSLFNRDLMHSMSEFQSCFLHINLLNDLFNQPYEKGYIWECYNGTFIYNLYSLLQENSLDFIHYLHEESPTIGNCFNYIIDLLKPQIPSFHK